MTGYTTLSLYTEGFTSTPRSINIELDGEVPPDEMLHIVRDMMDEMAEYGGFVGMITVLDQHSIRGIDTPNPSGESFYRYQLDFVPEVMDANGGAPDFTIQQDTDGSHTKSLDEWTEEAAASLA